MIFADYLYRGYSEENFFQSVFHGLTGMFKKEEKEEAAWTWTKSMPRVPDPANIRISLGDPPRTPFGNDCCLEGK